MPNDSKPTTLKDIAAQVGVSNMTVSAVLGSSPSRHVRVSEPTRARIIEAARRMQYRPNRAARSLRGRDTNIIGVYSAPNYLDPQVVFTAQIIGGLHRGCDERQKDLLLHGSYRSRSADDVFADLAGGGADGIILYTAPTDPLVARLAESSVPVVAIVDALPGLPSVVADDAEGAHLLAAHLAQQGRGPHLLYRIGGLDLPSASRRQQAFLDAAQKQGFEVTISRPPSLDFHTRFTDDEVDALLARPRSERTVVCWNDITAYDMLDHCLRRGLRVPHDLSVVGFDDVPAPRPTPWRLTTIRAPWVEVAAKAIDLLLRRMNGETLPAETVLPVALVPGDTA